MTQFDPRACVASALRTYRAELRRYVRSRIVPADVDNILQVAALHALEKADTLRDPSRVLPWLYRLHGNIVIDASRKRASERRLTEAMIAEAEPVQTEAVSTCDCSVAQVRQLSKNYPSILNLVDIAGVPQVKAAQTLNISGNNATVRLHRARTALKKRLLEHCGVPPARLQGTARRRRALRHRCRTHSRLHSRHR